MSSVQEVKVTTVFMYCRMCLDDLNAFKLVRKIEAHENDAIRMVCVLSNSFETASNVPNTAFPARPPLTYSRLSSTGFHERLALSNALGQSAVNINNHLVHLSAAVDELPGCEAPV